MKIRKLHIFLGLGVLLGSCGKNPQIADLAVTTPVTFRENKVLFVEENEKIGETRKLKFAYEINENKENEIEKLKPIGCVLRGVRIPKTSDFEKHTDIAVVIDVVTAGATSLTSLVVFYQRNVTGGQMLNFQDLLVYYEPEWDGLTPPYFRVRLLDVLSERNLKTVDILEQANKMSASLGGIIPHPVLPIVQTAAEAAKMIFGNKQNKVILDFQVQFYSPVQIQGSNSELLPLRKGEWVVVGREEYGSSSYWKNKFELDERTGELLIEPFQQKTNNADNSNIENSTKNENSENKKDLNVPKSKELLITETPYVSLVLFSADAVIPKHILDRSKVLIETLESASQRNNLDALGNSISALSTSFKAYQLERKVKKYFLGSDFLELIEVLKEQNDEDNKNKLSSEETSRLIRFFNDLTNAQVSSIEDLEKWHEKNKGVKFVKVEKEELKTFIYGQKWEIQN
ncbi:MAG: hypothetical protein LCH67_08270 [Bacteroidetes bacterium]|nr:hypothetical protein [Bacteroidota bacterium]